MGDRLRCKQIARNGYVTGFFKQLKAAVQDLLEGALLNRNHYFKSVTG
jgi:hypothetical protein